MLISHFLSIALTKKLIACKIISFQNDKNKNKYSLSSIIYIEENIAIPKKGVEGAKGIPGEKEANGELGKKIEIKIIELKSIIKGRLLKL